MPGAVETKIHWPYQHRAFLFMKVWQSAQLSCRLSYKCTDTARALRAPGQCAFDPFTNFTQPGEFLESGVIEDLFVIYLAFWRVGWNENFFDIADTKAPVRAVFVADQLILHFQDFVAAEETVHFLNRGAAVADRDCK